MNYDLWRIPPQDMEPGPPDPEDLCPVCNRFNCKCPPKEMKTNYFTFGQNHAHSLRGFTYDKDVIVKITAEDPRAVMFENFGRRWAMQYDESELPELLPYFPRGVKEL